MQKQVSFCFLYLMLGISISAFTQVTASDRKYFSENLNILRQFNNHGVSPFSYDNISIVFNDTRYSGIRAVSTKLMQKAYPDLEVLKFLKLFGNMSSSETILDKFLFQIFLFNEGYKSQTISTLETFCTDKKVATRIFTNYWSKYSKALEMAIVKNRVERKQIAASKTKYKSIFNSNNIQEAKIEDVDENGNLGDNEKQEDDTSPLFKGGAVALSQFFRKNLELFYINNTVDTSGTILVQFVIDTTGKVGDVKMLTEPLGHGLEKEVTRIIYLMPNWEPASKNGKPISSVKKQEITFVRNDGE